MKITFLGTEKSQNTAENVPLKYWFLFALGGIEEYKFPSLLLLTLAPWLGEPPRWLHSNETAQTQHFKHSQRHLEEFHFPMDLRL